MEKALIFIINNLPKKRAFFIGAITLLTLVVSSDNFFEKLVTSFDIRCTGYLLLLICWWYVWYLNRKKLPKNKINLVGIVVSITSENIKQEIRLKNDLVDHLNKLIIENNLGSVVNIILLNEHQSEFVNKILYEYTKNKTGKKEIKQLNKIKLAMHSHFYVFGSVKERQDGENKYFLSLNALVFYSPIDSNSKNFLEKEFTNIWFKEVSFLEKFEFSGFIFTADSVFIAVKYIVGIAAFFSEDFELSLKLHTSLMIDQTFQRNYSIIPNYKSVREKLNGLLAEENVMIARIYYHHGNIGEAKKYLNQSFSIKQSYAGLLFRAVIELMVECNPEKALNTIYLAKQEAKKIPGINGVWRYNEGFLLMYLEKFEQALKVYEKICRVEYPGEEITLNEVFEFNKTELIQNSNKIQSLFILGFLKFKKEENYPEAYKYFEEFLEKAKESKFLILVHKTEIYLSELKKFMKI